jgi:hypothetical protein
MGGEMDGMDEFPVVVEAVVQQERRMTLCLPRIPGSGPDWPLLIGWCAPCIVYINTLIYFLYTSYIYIYRVFMITPVYDMTMNISCLAGQDWLSLDCGDSRPHLEYFVF